MSCYQLIITITLYHNSKISFEKELLNIKIKVWRMAWNWLLRSFHWNRTCIEIFAKFCLLVVDIRGTKFWNKNEGSSCSFRSNSTSFIPHKSFYYMEESVLLGTNSTRRFHTPLHPGPEWRVFRMSPLWGSYRSMTSGLSLKLYLNSYVYHRNIFGSSSKVFGNLRQSSDIFGNFRKFLENVRERSSGIRKSSEIFGRWSEIFGKSSKTPS